MTILMAIDGLPGDGRVTGFEGWLKLSSFDWGASRGTTMRQMDRSGRQGTTLLPPQLRAITVRRQSDAVTPQVWETMITYTPKAVGFVWVRTGSDAPAAYLSLALEGALILGIKERAFGGVPEEEISISYETITLTVVNIGDNLSGPQDVVTYSMPQARRS